MDPMKSTPPPSPSWSCENTRSLRHESPPTEWSVAVVRLITFPPGLARRRSRQDATSSSRRPELEPYSLNVLQIGHDLKQVSGLGIRVRTKHPHQAFGRALCSCPKFVESNRGIDEIPQYGLSGFNVASEKMLDPLAEKCPAESRVSLHARADCLLEISCQSHDPFLPRDFLSLFVVIPPAQSCGDIVPLSLFRSSAEKDHHMLPLLTTSHPATRPQPHTTSIAP